MRRGLLLEPTLCDQALRCAVASVAHEIKCRLHESQMRERDMSVSIARFFKGGEMTRSVFVQTMKARILLVDLVKKEGILLFLLFFV